MTVPPRANAPRLLEVRRQDQGVSQVVLSAHFSEPSIDPRYWEWLREDLLALPGNLLIDLRRNKYVGRDLLGFLLSLGCEFEAAGRAVALTGISVRDRLLLKVLRLDTLLPFFTRPDDAWRHLRGGH